MANWFEKFYFPVYLLVIYQQIIKSINCIFQSEIYSFLKIIYKHYSLQTTNYSKSNMSESLKYCYKGRDTDLIVYVKSQESVEEYLESPNIGALSDTVETFQVFSNVEGKGSRGYLGHASKLQIENEFGKGKKVEEVIDMILKKGKPKVAKRIDNHSSRSYNNVV